METQNEDQNEDQTEEFEDYGWELRKAEVVHRPPILDRDTDRIELDPDDATAGIRTEADGMVMWVPLSLLKAFVDECIAYMEEREK